MKQMIGSLYPTLFVMRLASKRWIKDFSLFDHKHGQWPLQRGFLQITYPPRKLKRNHILALRWFPEEKGVALGPIEAAQN